MKKKNILVPMIAFKNWQRIWNLFLNIVFITVYLFLIYSDKI